ncbi:carbohydrate binding family 9 domain-containing protein [Arthrospiribacter ruber]|uniref:Membrane associated hydrolase n=1 Tax=Arthrospiribacter ruber TaxID=2487934 RepID=A0A951MHW0_9BACT|nr:carbohydrate binding family 9 domain-containing protein [Arthrospiribacter ruber]MBW3469566.1 hypothetical protein [Arthrospiribacter ruber]
MRFFWQLLIYLSFLALIPSALFGQSAFPPPEAREIVHATKIGAPVVLDGILDEAVWQQAVPFSNFTQRDPFQGEPATEETEIRMLYDEKYLYIGAICRDDLSKKSNIRVLNMRRDFSSFQNDRFGVAIDAFLDGQNSVGFEVTPYGSQRELQVIDGSEWDANSDWDGLWYVKTQISDTAWVAEMAIPWKTLRYREGTTELLVSFTRRIRRKNETVTFPAYPRAFSHFRMAYAARLTDLELPPPSANLQVNPYLLGNRGRTEQGNEETAQQGLKAGGEVKWAINPNTVLDATFNTDFAQADVDQQVQNLTRFSVLFPERRQFFLENANIFKTSISSFIQPFFSRRIGLDDEGMPLPLDGGLRLTSQTTKNTFGILAMRQRESGTNPGSHFLVGRYVRNFSDQNRVGLMVTHREDAPLDNGVTSLKRRGNTTATANAFLRPTQTINIEGMVSSSFDSFSGNGLAAHTWISQEKNWGYLGLITQYVSPEYNPRSGFLAFNDYVLVSPAFDLDLRPSWLPSYIRQYGPDFGADIFWRASDGQFQQAFINFAPIDFEFDKGGDIEFRLKPEWQFLDNTFSPLGVAIAPGYYEFMRYDVGFTTDFSRKIAGQMRYETGGYYDGLLNQIYADVRVSPIPHVELISAYTLNWIRGLGKESRDLDAHLWISTLRLGLNPRLQLITNYQWNSAASRDIWNVRFSWEYRPLSYLFVVFNSNVAEPALLESRFRQQELIGKLTFLKQF